MFDSRSRPSEPLEDEAAPAADAQSGKLRIDRHDAETSARPRGDATTEQAGELASSLAPGTIIAGRYLVEAPIGIGGHGAVHRAVHLALDLPVAVKVLGLSALAAPVQYHLAQRFAREARTIARIRHRNVLAVHDTGVLPDGSPYLVTELIEGDDLEHHIAWAPLGIPAVVDLGRQLFAALTAIAEAGVLHRDVKPANVMLRRESDEHVLLKLIDFGIARGPDEGARLTVSGQILGTPHYMAPEQLRGERLDVRVDLYAACAVLYEALTGRPPFDGSTAPVVIGKILGAPLAPIRDTRHDCPEELARLVQRGLAKKRSDRHPHPIAVVAQLDAIAHSLGLPTGGLAWADDGPACDTPPLALSRQRAKTPPDGAPRPPDEEPDPLEPENDEPPMPELPGHIQDPPPEHTAVRVVRAAGLLVLSLLAVALTLFLFGSETSPDDASVVSATAAPPRVVASAVDATPLLVMGLEALARGDVDSALTSYRAACAADPTRPEAHRGRALAASRAGLDEEAIVAFERYLALAPGAPDTEHVEERMRTLRARRDANATLPRRR